MIPVGSGVSPCDENLATQLEEGYLKVRPWTFSPDEQARSRASSQNRSRPTSLRIEGDPRSALASSGTSSTPPGGNADNLKPSDADSLSGRDRSPSQTSSKSFRLFGAHMNSIVTYQSETTAWLLTDDFMSRMSSTMYERFAGGGHFAGVKLTRGFVDVKKADGKDEKAEGSRTDTPVEANEPGTSPINRTSSQSDGDGITSATEKRRQRLERQMSSLIEPTGPESRERQEEEARKRSEEEMEDDYRDDDGNDQGREIEHLILVTHGIGQRLGLRIESINFTHDVNTLRRTLKDTYNESPDLQALNGDMRNETKNSRIQVLPVCWRHLLDFPKQSLKHNRQEHDLGEIALTLLYCIADYVQAMPNMKRMTSTLASKISTLKACLLFGISSLILPSTFSFTSRQPTRITSRGSFSRNVTESMLCSRSGIPRSRAKSALLVTH